MKLKIQYPNGKNVSVAKIQLSKDFEPSEVLRLKLIKLMKCDVRALAHRSSQFRLPTMILETPRMENRVKKVYDSRVIEKEGKEMECKREQKEVIPLLTSVIQLYRQLAIEAPVSTNPLE